MAISTTEVYVKCSNCSVSFDPEFEKLSTTDDGFDRYRIMTGSIPKTGAVFTFKTQHGYRLEKVSVYKNPVYDRNSNTFGNYGTLISDDAGSVVNIPKESAAFLIISEAVSDSGINFKYPDAPKFRNQVTPHVYFKTVKGDSILSPFSENTTVKANTEYSAHVGETGKIEADDLSRDSVFTVEISKTLFDKETDDESTPDFPGFPIFDDPSGGKK